eukprot:CAMPEP_0195059674 /NCGR_PEP_ID=MMETSP0448-20130528/7108_1 /TAXON_ID=66468 /ORGANISM="Heterocapsa triquestra, Strain CCMP 448" /LENGTH=522 /DNA_ID=CAMNT_0040089989 /DNA_START=21 /DNA_END=1589 /DNA_ORIENTATION=+
MDYLRLQPVRHVVVDSPAPDDSAWDASTWDGCSWDGSTWAPAPCQAPDAWQQPLPLADPSCCAMGEQQLQFADLSCCVTGEQQAWTVIAIAVPVEAAAMPAEASPTEFAELPVWDTMSSQEFAEPTAWEGAEPTARECAEPATWDSENTTLREDRPGSLEEPAKTTISPGAARRRRRKILRQAINAAVASSDIADRVEVPSTVGNESAACTSADTTETCTDVASGAAWVPASSSIEAFSVPEDEEWCGQLTKGLEAGGAAATDALLAMKGSSWQLACGRMGCRVVQKALEVAVGSAAAEILRELRGHVLEAVESPYANYVIQRVVEVMPMSQHAFVAEELLGAAALVACHRFGCRILCRLFEHSPRDARATAMLCEEVMAEAGKLSRHSFAHHIVESILEHMPHQRARIAAALRQDLWRSACSRNASHVIETALKYCSLEVQKAFSDELLCDMDSVMQLAQSQFGAYVVRTLLQLGQPRAVDAMRHLRSHMSELQATKHGRRLAEALGPVLAERSPSATAAA